jgi:hypothetical protein
MWWSNYSLMWQLAKLIPRARGRTSWTHVTKPTAPVARFGCCPVCHEFVRIEPSLQAGGDRCPNCGRLIRSLDSLGSETSLGAADE